MFQYASQTSKDSKKKNSDSPDKKPGVNYSEMMQAAKGITQLGSNPVQLFVDEEDEKAVQKKSITTQNKGGLNINSDSSLENEADVMGAKAARGENTSVAGNGSGIQRQEGDEQPPRKLSTTPTEVALTDTGFWDKVDIGYYRDGGLLYVVANASSKLSPIERNDEELFEETATRESQANNFDVVVNGNMYDVSNAGLADAFMGHDPVAADATTPEGHVIQDGSRIAGTDEPNLFHFAQMNDPDNPFKFGFGNPPQNASAAIGGVGPLIIDGLKYGETNRYSEGVPEGAPLRGEPGNEYRQFLTQRSNLTYSAMHNRHAATGKNIFAYNSSRKKIMVLIQPHATLNMRISTLRDNLYNLGFDNAVFLDGSDSVMLMLNDELQVQQAEDKDETNTIGLGINVN